MNLNATLLASFWGGSVLSSLNFLGLAQQPSVATDPVDEDAFLNKIPSAFEHLSVSFVRDNLAVIPGDWDSGDLKTPFYDIRSNHASFQDVLSQIKSTDFIAWDPSFFHIIGSQAKLKKIQSFEEEPPHVHEAPVFVPETNELFYADTSVTGWLWAINVDTYETRKVTTNPPLANVNGARYHNGRVYAATNGGTVRAIYSINPLDGTATPIVNNYRGRHLNSPNDLIFDGNGNMWFTDPSYGWFQKLAGVQPPELPDSIYFLDMNSKALVTVSNSVVTAPNGLVFAPDGSTLYVADSNSTASRPLQHYPASLRNIWAFDVHGSILTNPRLIHQTEGGWPDGLQVTKDGYLMIAVLGGVDVVDPKSGRLLGKINTPGDIIYNLAPAYSRNGQRMWLLSGTNFIYKVLLKD